MRCPISSDNCIAVLTTPIEDGFEYRVTHAQAIDNLDFEVPEGWDYNPQMISFYFDQCKSFVNKEDADKEAERLHDEVEICEYGILDFMAKYPFSDYVIGKHQPPDCTYDEIARGDFLRLVKKDRWELVERINSSGAVMAIPLTDDNYLILVQQFRIPLDCDVIEWPAGLVGDTRKGETELDAIHAELIEETGYDAGNMQFLTKGPKSPGMTNEETSYYLATGLVSVGSGKGDETENIKVHEVHLLDIEEWLQKRIDEGIKIDPSIYVGLYFVQKFLDNSKKWLPKK